MRTFITSLLTTFMAITGCEKQSTSSIRQNEITVTISPDSEEQSIEIVIGDLELDFGLINEKGESATIFNEGENITFHFEFENVRNDDIIVSSDIINESLFRVFRQTDMSPVKMGRSWTGVWCAYRHIEPKGFQLASGDSKVLTIPWVTQSVQELEIYPFCAAEILNSLPVGKYTTTINYTFHYEIDGETKNINPNFQIDFEVR